jgi:hypothetical protein
MKKSDLKQLIKPLVKECIHEVLIEEGLLSNVVSEVAKGMQTTLMVESAPIEREVVREPARQQSKSDNRKKLQEHRKKLLGAIDKDAYNGVDLFEGIEPIAPQGGGTSQGSPDLGNPGDAGVDISSLMGGASKIWKAMK